MINVSELKTQNPRFYRDLVEALQENTPAAEIDDAIRAMSPFEALDTFLNWNGIIGYTETIRDAVHTLNVVYFGRV